MWDLPVFVLAGWQLPVMFTTPEGETSLSRNHWCGLARPVSLAVCVFWALVAPWNDNKVKGLPKVYSIAEVTPQESFVVLWYCYCNWIKCSIFVTKLLYGSFQRLFDTIPDCGTSKKIIASDDQQCLIYSRSTARWLISILAPSGSIVWHNITQYGYPGDTVSVTHTNTLSSHQPVINAHQGWNRFFWMRQDCGWHQCPTGPALLCCLSVSRLDPFQWHISCTSWPWTICMWS